MNGCVTEWMKICFFRVKTPPQKRQMYDLNLENWQVRFLQLLLGFRNVKIKGKPVIITLEFSENWYPVSTVFALVKKESLLKYGIGCEGFLATSWYMKSEFQISFIYIVKPKLQMSGCADPWPSTSPKQYTQKCAVNIWVINIVPAL